MFRVAPVLLLILCVHFALSEEDGPPLYAKEPVEAFIMPNQRQSVDDCHYRYQRYVPILESRHLVAGGRPTFLREFAHMAAIGWSQPDGSTVWSCGGSLIWENYILTAAHCAADTDNVEPDVVRFADQNLYDDGDDEYAQQRTIVAIIRHPDHVFSRRYNDIALLRLNSSVSFHDTVAPACLWNDDDGVPSQSMEAIGWGEQGFAQQHSSVLLKVSLRPVDINECRIHYPNSRGMPSGLHVNQMCAGDAVMDTCRGDSGGPLQIKLLHNFRMTPFIVAVTSFGSACGLSVPGVYTRVAPYIPWILSTLRNQGEHVTESMFQHKTCALRNAAYREYDPSVLGLKMAGAYQELYFDRANIEATGVVQEVSIHWNGTTSSTRPDGGCHGVIIDETTIITLARCTAIDGVPPAYVRYSANGTIAVARHFRHPQYAENSQYYDIGVLKLAHPLEFSSSFYPACPWYANDRSVAKVKVSGTGMKELHNFYPSDEVEISRNETVHVAAVGYEQTGSNCSLPAVYSAQLGKGLSEEHLCFGNGLSLLPGMCNQTLGGSIHSEVEQWRRRYTYLHALNQLGRNCGFGDSAVGIRIAYHTDWLWSILLPEVTAKSSNEEDDADDSPMIFVNRALEEGDRCRSASGSSVDGVCVDSKLCPKVSYDFRTGLPVTFCRTVSLVCCPTEFVRNGTNDEWREIEECANNTRALQLSTSVDRNPEPSKGSSEEPNGELHQLRRVDQNRVSIISSSSSVETGSDNGCIGTIITSRSILAEANCVSKLKLPAHVPLEDGTGERKSLPVESVILHPQFDSSARRHNIALVRIGGRFDAASGKAPACLWTNTTHTPFELMQTLLTPVMLPDGDRISFTFAHPRYNADCRAPFGRALQPEELCLDVQLPYRFMQVANDEPALWIRSADEDDGNSITYLVAIPRQVSSTDETVFLHTRIASYVSWIKSVL